MRRVILAILPFTTAVCLHAEDGAGAIFVRRLLPLFSEKCLACHGKDEAKIKAGYDMRTAAAAFKGGESGKPAIVRGKPAESPLYLAVTRKHDDWEPMPPKEADKLTAEQVGWIKDWIVGGAPWPDAAQAAALAKANADQWSAGDGVTVKTGGGLSPDWTNRRYKPEGLWAYQPVKKPPVPVLSAQTSDNAPAPKKLSTDALSTEHSSSNPIDAFIAAKMPAGLQPAPPADRATLIRRATFDLTGLPPKPEGIEAFAADRDSDAKAFAKVVERLRASPHYGERMAQHWLDVVRYADSSGFANDHERGNAWRYRDYVVRAFNGDKLSERPAPFLPNENISGFEERKYLESLRAEYLAKLEELDAKLVKNAERWFVEKGADTTKWNAAIDRVGMQPGANRNGKRREFASVFGSARNVLTKQGVPEEQFPPKLVGFGPEDYGNERVARKGLERLKWELDRYEPVTLAVYSGRTPDVKSVLAPVRMPASRMTDGELEETCVLTGGDPFASGQKVKPGVLTVLAEVQKTPIPDAIEGRRKAFADWVASPENPLTARAIVNRIWLWHFGEPLAGNPNNFGSTGKKPTHPELLDWLAATFVEQGGSFKAMHRVMMTSETYRRSSVISDKSLVVSRSSANSGPAPSTESLITNYLLFRPRRLTAEELRDAMLAATGELNPTLGGIPNRPEINLEAALQPRQVMGTFANAWTPNPKPEQRHRRSIYALKIRGLVDPMFEVFNAPAPDFSCERRDASTVTPQVFSLFNGRASYDRALALANRAVKETNSDDAALTLCFQLAYGRKPNAEELSATLAHWRAMETKQNAVKLETPKPPLDVKREAVEENTGEKFSFNEKLEAYADFIPDLQPSAVDARTRALADVCLVLFNSNEFAYVY